MHSTRAIQQSWFKTPVDIEEQVDLSNTMIGTEKRRPLLHTFVSAIEKRGSKVECGHFVSYSRTSHNTVMMYDDHLVSQKSLQKYLTIPSSKEVYTLWCTREDTFLNRALNRLSTIISKLWTLIHLTMSTSMATSKLHFPITKFMTDPNPQCRSFMIKR